MNDYPSPNRGDAVPLSSAFSPPVPPFPYEAKTLNRLRYLQNFRYPPSALPGVVGLLGDVGERIFSRVEAMDGVIGVLGAEPTWKENSYLVKRLWTNLSCYLVLTFTSEDVFKDSSNALLTLKVLACGTVY